MPNPYRTVYKKTLSDEEKVDENLSKIGFYQHERALARYHIYKETISKCINSEVAFKKLKDSAWAYYHKTWANNNAVKETHPLKQAIYWLDELTFSELQHFSNFKYPTAFKINKLIPLGFIMLGVAGEYILTHFIF